MGEDVAFESTKTNIYVVDDDLGANTSLARFSFLK